MKTLIRKELRENLVVTVLGFVVLLLFILMKCLNYAWALKHGEFGQETQPVMDRDVVTILTFFCAIFGSLLGWLQIHHERHRDLWAFLVHRPLTRTQIFLGKTIAGLLLYALMPGMVLLGCILWVAIPGHVPAPFEWRMVLPITAAFLGGIVYYFAGMLTGLRQARWYASRGLGLAMAILVSVAVQNSFLFCQALLYITASVAVLGTAVWGAFHSEGHYEGQPVPGKTALATALAAGVAPVLLIVTLLVLEIAFRGLPGEEWSNYVMTRNGAIYKVVSHNNSRSWVPAVDVNGQAVKDAFTIGRNEGPDILQGESGTTTISLPTSYEWRRWPNFQNSLQFITMGNRSGNTLWWYWRRYNCLAGYDLSTRRLLGTIGPEGFSAGPPGGARAVGPAAQRNWEAALPTLTSSNELFEVDLDRRVARKIFTSEDGQILRAVPLMKKTQCIYLLVVADRSVSLLNPDGTRAWKQDFKPAHWPPYEVRVSQLEPPGRFALWVSESGVRNRAPSVAVTCFGNEQEPFKRVQLAGLPRPSESLDLLRRLLCVSLPPVVPAFEPLIEGQSWPSAIPREMLRISFIAALACIPAVWWLGRRYHSSVGANVGWSGFILLTGIPGMLAFLCVQEWPARESCPNCGKLRVVDREQCEHCRAHFAPPDKTGTEIFEPAGAAQP